MTSLRLHHRARPPCGGCASWVVAVLALPWATVPCAAQDKSGVSPTTISRPTGPGSLEGLGDAFQPALNSGTARYQYAFKLPAGIAGMNPVLSLRYDGGLGFGPAGVGWTFDPGSIRRQTDKGLPRYADGDPIAPPDRFLGIDGEELVPLQNGFFLAKIEGAFVRYRRVGDSWEAHAKNGSKLEFGLTDEARLSDPTGTMVYQWCLQRQTDTNSNVVEYEYARPSAEDRQVYLSGIRYGAGGPPWAHVYAVRLFYEDRPDPRTDYRSGFLVQSTQRLTRVDVLHNDALIRRYELGYAAHPHWSLLTTITHLGDDAATALPTTTFAYAVFDPGDPHVALSANGHIIGAVNEPGAVFDNQQVDLIDLNADGLPDLLSTGTGHAVYLNRGVEFSKSGEAHLHWEGPLVVTADDIRALSQNLTQSNVHLADMTGDGVADLVVTEPGLVEYFENTGQNGWGVGQLMSTQQSPPPAPFGLNGAHVRTADLDFDKRIDIIKSDFGAYSLWYNLGDNQYSDEVVVAGAFYLGQFVDFADRGVDLADVNGDRLLDIVKITAISVVYFPSMGFGRFDTPIEMALPDRALDDSPNGNLSRAKMIDINGDGLADLVVERAEGNHLWFWLNLGNDSFAPSCVVTGLPALSATAAVRWADINGNGTTDLVYGDSTQFTSKIQAVDLAVLIAGTPHLNALTAIDNGFGRRTEIEYGSSTEYFLNAHRAGHPWSTAVPFPVQVVARTVTSIGLDLDGYPDEGPDGDIYVSEFVYRDGFYDYLEKQFRGFAFVKKIEHGDERFGGSRAPALVTRMAFHTGAPDGIDNDGNGQTDEAHPWNGREEEALKGVELWHERTSLPDDPTRDGHFAADAVVFDRVVNSWTLRTLSSSSGGPLPSSLGAGYTADDEYQRTIRHAVLTRVETTLVERQTDPALHKSLERRMDLDTLGNTSFEWNLGDLTDTTDDIHTEYEYARNETAWIMDRVSRTVQRDGGSAGAFVSESRNYFDGAPFAGLPLGQLGSRGNLHRSEALISGGTVPPLTERSYLRGDPRDPGGKVETLRQQLSAFGNPIVMLDGNALLASGLPDGQGHERHIEYDPFFHRFPIRETIVVGAGRPNLEVTADYHFGFGTPLSISDFNGHKTHYRYDALGRLSAEVLPGDPQDQPTRSYAYDWKAPFSAITTTAHAREGGSPAVVSTQYFDGLGRSLGMFNAGGPVADQITMYNPRGQAWRVFQPYFGEPTAGGAWLPPAPAWHATDTTYDAIGRIVQSISPADNSGIRAQRSTLYLPLTTIESDGEDNDATGPHANTPRTLIYDGLNRLIEVREMETLSPADSGEFVTRYRYAMPDLPAEIEDANGNIKYMRYDGLGRRIFMNDCNRGHLTSTFDAVGNVLHTVDAKGQRIDFAYDGANRLLSEDYLDDGTPLSLQRSPDVVFHYDLPAPDYPWLRNTPGQLAWIEDHTGAEFRAYDARGQLETVVKRVAQPDGSTREFTTVIMADSLGREYQMAYPSGSIVRRQYNARGLLEAISGFVDSLTYDASGQKKSCDYSNSATTTYFYDPRLRLTKLLTQSVTGVWQDLAYSLDQADNIVAIHDGRSLSPGDPRTQTATFDLDNSYRLQRAIGTGYGTIEYDYDRLGNMVHQSSPDIGDPLIDMGAMTSGGLLGTFGRVGRAAGEAPGPHALTAANGGTAAHSFDYDANGNMTAHGSTSYEFDFKNRLGSIVNGGPDTRYLYDHSDRRVIKRVDGAQTTYINKGSEVRDGRMIQYVFAGDTRVAQFEGLLPPPATVAQRIPLAVGWNLVSFQVDPGETNPAVLLAEFAMSVETVFGFDGITYISWQPSVGGPLSQLRPNHGYWILMRDPAEWMVEGPLNTTPVEIAADAWSLIGLPGMAPRSRTDLQSDLPNARAVWAYAGDLHGWQVMNLDSPSWLNTLHTTAAGLGYWVMPDSSAELTPPPPSMMPPVFYHPDHLGSTNLTTGIDGTLRSEMVYYPFGAIRYQANHNLDSAPLPAYGFSDKERDAESGLNYFEARYCDTALSRFTAVDPTIALDPMRFARTPQVLNLYAYAANNPLRYVDPTGHDPTPAQQAKQEKVKSAGSFFDILGGVVEATKDAVKSAVPKPTQAAPSLVPVVPRAGLGGAFAKVAKSVTPVLGTVGQGVGVVTGGLGVAETLHGVESKNDIRIIGGLADAAASLVGLAGGTLGAAGAGGYAVGGLIAPVIDKNTGHFERSTAKGHVAESLMTKATGNETLGKVFGAATAGVESVLPGQSDTTLGVLKWLTD